jgi:hypothetical protein
LISRRGALLALAGVATTLAGCAAQTGQLLRQRPADLPPVAELDETPFHPQLAYQCGPAALATVLGALGVRSTPEQLAQKVFLPARQGTLQVEMVGGARREGVVPTRIPGQLEAILKEIAAGHPVVVLQNLGLDVLPVWHYAVVVGYDFGREELVLRSGVVRRELMRMSVFEHTWVRAGSWGFVVRPPGLWPVTAELPAVEEACIGFERAAEPALALRAYASAVQRWPRSLALAIGLGNTAYGAGQKVLAADSFQTAARTHRSTPAWINLSRTLLDAGLVDSAWRVALEAEYLNDPAWREETTKLLRELQPLRASTPAGVVELQANPSSALR